MTSKEAVRRRVWAALVAAGAARFPGAEGRIPNFVGAEAAAARLAGLEVWRRARRLKANPDSPQRPVRLRALQEGKVVYMAVPRLREAACFLELDPARLPAGVLREAATIKGAFRLGRPVTPEEVPRLDLVVAGAVAVNRRGVRIGKGGGYSDLEYGLGRAYGFLTADTPVVTTVHPLQVLEEALPRERHDLVVDWILTPEAALPTDPEGPRPEGIYWDLLTEEQIRAMPALQRLRARQEG